MLKIENTDTFGWEVAIRGMRNPMNSWDKSDSRWDSKKVGKFIIGPNDVKLMKTLGAAGNDHGKFLRMIGVSLDIIAPLYWWKEFDTYKVGTVANSCSTMHKIAAKEFTLDDFSREHLLNENDERLEWGNFAPLIWLKILINILNENRKKFIKTKDKVYWWQMIQLLPSSYNQRRTVMLNYAVLKNIYHARRNHKLDEWNTFCDWIKELPFSELITVEEEKKDEQKS